MFPATNGIIPLEAQYFYRRALFHSSEGEKEEAVNCLKKAVLIAPRFCKAINEMGNCLAELGRYDEAVRKFEQVIRIDPGHEEARFKRDLLLSRTRYSDSYRVVPAQGKTPMAAW